MTTGIQKSTAQLKSPNIHHKMFVDLVIESLNKKENLRRPALEKKAGEFGISDKRLIKELTEYAVLLKARELAENAHSKKTSYERMVQLYFNQPSSSFRSSESIKLQQYSTPLPIAYLLGCFVKKHSQGAKYLEPSAGNGFLTVALPPDELHVNEIDPIRYSILEKQNFNTLTRFDAREIIAGTFKKFDGVLSNPPFGKLPKPVRVSGTEIMYLDHLMILKALESMKDSGRAAFIMGGHLRFDGKERISKGSGRYFFNHIFSLYHVLDLIHLDGSAFYSRQGTGQDITILLIDSSKQIKSGAAPLKRDLDIAPVKNHQALYERIAKHFTMDTSQSLRERAIALKAKLEDQTLGAPYLPTSDACVVLDTQTPDSMAFEMHSAMEKIRMAVGGDIDNFVRHRLGYSTSRELCQSLAAEQIDAVAMAIYNIEAKDQGCIIGDQTGIGKGRIAASLIRYACHNGYKPIFITGSPNLFSDLYRDLIAIGSSHLRPFIVNAREDKTSVRDLSGNILYQAPDKYEQQRVFESHDLSEYDFVMATYSQFNSQELNLKKQFLLSVVKDQILISDESHNASGSSNTGAFLQKVVSESKSTIFLSATYAKRAENMPIYALKTAMSDANMTPEALSKSISSGGVAMQEIIASELVAQGQMIRRERSYEGVKVEYSVLEQKRIEHCAAVDRITAIMRDIIAFQENHISPLIERVDSELASEGKEIRKRGGTSKAGVDNILYFSKIFNVINQMLFALKADDVASVAIDFLKQGKKPVIAFSSTMGSFLSQIVEEENLSVGQGDPIRTDFALILKNGLNGVMRYTVTDHEGNKTYGYYSPNELESSARIEYQRIMSSIDNASSGLYLSPIDIILDRIHEAGYSAHEVTGRNLKINYSKDRNTGTIQKRKKIIVNEAFADFNNNQVDVLLINQSGSTGASAHAIATDKVPASEVKPRVMIVLQMELNVDTEVQKRGRIFRTGQIYLPEYYYIISSIAAEKRMMMMMRQKLKSLDANTSSNQDQNKKMIDVPDFLNKYGDKVISDYLQENPSLHHALGFPELGAENGEVAQRVSGRIAVMPTNLQESFYNEIVEQYLEYVDYLKQAGEYDLEVENLNLAAKTISKKVIVAGNGSSSSFGKDSFLEKVEVNALKKPFKKVELKNLIDQTLSGKSADEYSKNLLGNFEAFQKGAFEDQISKINDHYDRLIKDASENSRLLKIKSDKGEKDYQSELEIFIKSLLDEHKLKTQQLENKFLVRKKDFTDLVNFFTVGRALLYRPHFNQEPVFATFLGFDIKTQRSNPYAPSAVKLRFAFASSLKYLILPSSFNHEIMAIKGESLELAQYSIDELLDRWNSEVENKQKDRVIRYIITGNILQGAGWSQSGKLISYTSSDEQIKKGILLPEFFSVQDDAPQGVSVPLIRAFSHITSRPVNSLVPLSSGISIAHTGGGDYQIRIPASKAKGGEFYLDDTLIALTSTKKFEKVGDTMRAYVEPGEDFRKFIHRLDELKVNIILSDSEFNELEFKMGAESGKIRPIVPAPAESDSSNEILVLRAKALSLKLKLLTQLIRA